MLLEAVWRQHLSPEATLRVLDACAAPGGKSTHLQSLMSAESLLVSNETINGRVGILRENLVKWGGWNTVVSQNDPADFGSLPGFFDVMLVDAPCSGSGLFRKEPQSISEWSEERVGLCSRRQHRILDALLPALKPGGLLIYSTCSYSVEENEDQVDQLLESGRLCPLTIQIQPEWGVVETRSSRHGGAGYRCYPHHTPGEGFFLSAFRLTEAYPTTNVASLRTRKTLLAPVSSAESSMIRPLIRPEWPAGFLNVPRGVAVLPQERMSDVLHLAEVLHLRQAGILAGEGLRGEWIPSHALAMSPIMAEAYTAIPLDKPDALNYLRHQTFGMSEVAPGWYLATYEGLPLGFMKRLQGRTNNYYPREWRIINK